MAEPVALKYHAFISYSHADTGWAKWPHRGLEGFRIDEDLVRETALGAIPRRAAPHKRCDPRTAQILIADGWIGVGQGDAR
jgi:hypothetical protein